MQAVIIAAGKSTRTYPLTLTRPKPLLKVANKSLLEHNLGFLKGVVDEAVIIVGYRKEQIMERFGNQFGGIHIKYAEQKNQAGTGNALLAAEGQIKGGFISLHGDDIYSHGDLRRVADSEYSILTGEVQNPSSFGVILERNGFFADLIEKPENFTSSIVNTGLYNLDSSIFPILRSLKKSKRNEYELTDAIRKFASVERIRCVHARQWIPIGYPIDLLKADGILRKKKNAIGKNSEISGSVKDSSIGDNCVVKGDVEGSIVMDNSVIGKKSNIKNSVLGENVIFEGAAIGAVIADNVRAENVTISEGVCIYPDKRISGRISSDML